MQEAKTERNASMMLERISGDTYQAIGERHGISSPMATKVVVREARRHLEKLELELMVAAKLDQAYSLAIPNQAQGDRQIALDYVAWAVRELRKRGVEVAVTTKPVSDGIIVTLTDVRTNALAREAEQRRQSR